MKENLILDNARFWKGDGTVEGGYLVIRNGKIAHLSKGSYIGEDEVINLDGMAVSPGLIDLMVLGGFGRSILKDTPLEIAREYLKLGVTACQFCTGNLPWDKNIAIGDKIKRAQSVDTSDASKVLGLYMEGPFMLPGQMGAGLETYGLPPSRNNVTKLVEGMDGALTMINISPGTEGDVEAIRLCKESELIVSMAHSNAPIERIEHCVEAGTSILGHVFCNNPGLVVGNVQQPTIDHFGLTDERIRYVHLICDGIHTAPTMIRLVHRCRSSNGLILVTDGIPHSGCPDGPFTWDDGRTFHKEGGVGRTEKGWLMGSATLLPDMFRNYVQFTGTAPEKAIQTVTLNPAKSLGLDGEIGLLKEGRVADLVAWDEQLRIRRVWRAGREVKPVSDFAEVELDKLWSADCAD